MNSTAQIPPSERAESGSDTSKDGESATSPRPGRNAAALYRNGLGGPGCAARTAARPAALPCLKSNNSTDRDTDAAAHRLTGGHMRTAFALEENVKLMAENFGINRLGFLTLTFADLVTSIKEAQRRFNSLRTHVLSVRYTKNARQVGTRFGWATGAGRVWRAKLARWAKTHRFADMEELKAAYGPRWAYHCMDSILATIPDLEMSAQEAESAGIPRPLQEMADRLGKGCAITITHTLLEVVAANGDGNITLKPAAVVMFGVRRAWGRMEYRLFSRVRLITVDSHKDFAKAAASVEQNLTHQFAAESRAWLAAEWPSYLAAIERRA